GLLTSVSRKDGKTDSFGYDLLPELTSASYGKTSRTVRYTWDAAGNRMTMTDSAGPSSNYGQATNLNQYLTDGTTPVTNDLSYHEMTNYQNVNYTYINDTHLS